MKKFILILLLIIGCICTNIQSLSATIITPAGIEKEAKIVVPQISDPVGKVWAQGYLTHLQETLSSIQKQKNTSETSKLLKKEIIANATNFIADIKNNIYTYTISSSERKTIEDTILGYQKEIVTIARKYLKEAIQSDIKETGNIHFTLRSNDVDVTLHMSPYRVISSNKNSDLEIDTKITINVTEKKLNDRFEITLDGFVKLVDQDLYISLRDYSIIPPKNELIDISSYNELIKEIRGKVYHQKIENKYLSKAHESATSRIELLNQINPILDILENESFLTPIAKTRNLYILGMNSKTAKHISRSQKGQEKSIFYNFPSELATGIPLPVEIYTDGKQVFFSRLNETMRTSGAFSRDQSNIFIFNIDISEVGTQHPGTLNIHNIWNDWILYGGIEQYGLSMRNTPVSTTGTLKKWNKTIGTLKIDAAGINAWTYDLSGIWEYTPFSWSDEEIDTKSEDISVHLWWNLQKEFGQFMITPPTLSEELATTNYAAKTRDKTRKSNLSMISSLAESFFYDYGTYPKTPRNTCTTSIRGSTYDYESYTDYKDPQELKSISCKNWYYYRWGLDDSGNPEYIIATRVEQKSSANIDISKISISTWSIDTIRENINTTGSISSNDPNNWYYVVVSDNQTYEY